MVRLKNVLLVFVGCFSKVCMASLPNIVIFMADDLEICDIGIFGNTSLRTPNIDRIGDEGVQLGHHLSADSACTPSRAAFLTGRYPIRTGLGSYRRVIRDLSGTAGLQPEEITVAEHAKKAGYHTSLIGKWHLGLFNKWRSPVYHPMNQGFDEFYGIPFTNSIDFELPFYYFKSMRYSPISFYLPQIIVLYLSFVFPVWIFFHKNYTSVLELYCLHYLHLYHLNAFNSVLMRGYNVIEQQMRVQGLTKRVVDESINVLEHCVNSDKPLLLFVSWQLTHTSLQPMDQFAGKSSYGKYGDCVEGMDWGVGEIMAALDRLYITDNTIVYFTSDNGGHIEAMVNSNGGYNGIYKGGKSWGAVEGSMRVPGLIKWPGKLPVKHVVQEPRSMLDIFPTLSDIMGDDLPMDRHIDGRNMLQNLNGNSQISPHEFMMHYCGDDLQAVTYIPKEGKKV